MKLSFDFETELKFLNRNSFGDEIDFLFIVNSCQYIFWVNTVKGLIIRVSESSRDEVDEFADNSDKPRLTDEQYEQHKNDAKVLNSVEYITKLQKIIDNL